MNISIENVKFKYIYNYELMEFIFTHDSQMGLSRQFLEIDLGKLVVVDPVKIQIIRSGQKDFSFLKLILGPFTVNYLYTVRVRKAF